MKIISWGLTLFLCWSASAYAASFDCSQASSRAEKLICSNASLSALDEQLGVDYASAQEHADMVDAVEIDRLKRGQRIWLRSVRDRCADVACLERAYKARLNELNPLADMELTCEEMRRWPGRVFTGFVDLGSGSGSPTQMDYGCPDSLSRLDFMQGLLRVAERIRGGSGSSVCTGTIVHAQWRYYQFSLTQAGIAPQTLQTGPAKITANWKTFLQEDASGTAVYFRQWSERSLFNNDLYLEFVREFDKAAAELVRLYIQKNGMSPSDAQVASLAALGLVAMRAAGSAPKSERREESASESVLLNLLRAGPASKSEVAESMAGLGSASVAEALKVALIRNQPLEVVVLLTDELLQSGVAWPEHDDTNEPEVADTTDGFQVLEQEHEPLLSLALGSYVNLEYLLRKKFPVDLSNDFGKTTLFYAIGSSNHDAVELLLQYEANVNHTYKSAKELRPDDDKCIYPDLRHTRRSTLMHAAQNSDVRMLQILLKAGARLNARDDVGFNAYNYAVMGKKQDNIRYLATLGLEPAAQSYRP